MLNLFDYQQRAVDAVLSCGVNRPLIVSPTGTGKTITGLGACRHFGSVLWVAHRKELLDQALESAARMGVTINARTIQGLDVSGTLPDAELLVVDEAHHLLADEWSKLAEHYPRILGLTATPELADGTGLGAIFQQIIVATTIKEAVAMGRLVPCTVIAPSKPLKGGQIAQHPVTAYQKHAAGRKAVLFAPNVASAMQFSVEFMAAGIKAAYVHGGMTKAVRETVFAEYAAGKYQVLCNVTVATEGWDDPPTSCVIIARGCGTPGLYVQMVGRGLRAAPGKTSALVLDLRGVSHVHGDPMEDRVYSLQGRGIRRKAEMVDQRYCACCGVIWAGSPCPECGMTVEPMAPPKVVNAKLEKRVYLPKATEEERVKKLRALMAEGRAKGWKPNAAMVRYQVLFGSWPDGKVMALAKRG